MITSKLIVVSLLFALLGACGTATNGQRFSGTSESLQHDLDIIRLQDLRVLSGHIEEYKRRTGRYPFEGETDVPHYVHIATNRQMEYPKQIVPSKHKLTSARDFVNEMESTLGSDIQIPFDLQIVPVNKPNFYIYMVIDDVYFLAVHLHNNFSFTNKVSEYYYKVEVTNYAKGTRTGTWLREKLLINHAYLKASTERLLKPGYAESRRTQLGGNNAF